MSKKKKKKVKSSRLKAALKLSRQKNKVSRKEVVLSQGVTLPLPEQSLPLKKKSVFKGEKDYWKVIARRYVDFYLNHHFVVHRGTYNPAEEGWDEEDNNVYVSYYGEESKHHPPLDMMKGYVEEDIFYEENPAAFGFFHMVTFRCFSFDPPLPDNHWTFLAHLSEADFQGHQELIDKFWKFILETTPPGHPIFGWYIPEYFEKLAFEEGGKYGLKAIYPRLQELWTEVIDAIGYHPDIKAD